MKQKNDKISEQIEERKEDLKSLEPKLEELRTTVNDKERHKKQLKENISILESRKRVEELNREIERLKDDRGSIEGGDTAHEEVEKAEAEKQKLMVEQANIEGRWREIMDNVRSLSRKLATPEYKGIDEQCRVAEIKYTTTQMAAEDLKKYSDALDHALLQFHGKKINDINKVKSNKEYLFFFCRMPVH